MKAVLNLSFYGFYGFYDIFIKYSPLYFYIMLVESNIPGFYHFEYLKIEAFIREYNRLEGFGIDSAEKRERIIFRLLQLLPSNPSEIEAFNTLNKLYKFCLNSEMDICRTLRFMLSKVIQSGKSGEYLKSPAHRMSQINSIRENDIVQYLIITNRKKYDEIREKLIKEGKWGKYNTRLHLEAAVKKVLDHE